MPALLGVAGLALVQIPYVGVLQSVGVRGIEEGHSPSVVLQFGLGSGLLLVAALHSPRLGRALSSRLGRFFGRISYSFYLLHDTILLSFVVRARHHGFAWPTGIAITVLTFALTVALSALAWRFVEAPAIRAGRWVIRTGESMFQRTAVE